MNLPPDDLDREYHRASAADDSRPSERVRAAILEHARKGIGQSPGQVSVPGVDLSVPAANDSRWRWQAAAGIAAVGFAGVLAVLLYRGNPNPEPVATARLESVAPLERSAADAFPAESQTKVAPREPAAPTRQRDAAPEPQRAEAARETELRSDELVAATAAPPVTSPPLAEIAADGNDAVAAAQAVDADSATGLTARASAEAAPAALTAAAGARAPVGLATANAIVRQYFPEALDSDEVAVQYWVLMSREGNVLRSGQRNSTDQGELIGFLESSFSGIRTGEIQMLEFVNQRGRRLVIAQVFLAEGSPAP
jgi:hypothetical protein